MGKITEVGDNNFYAEVLSSDVPVLVVFGRLGAARANPSLPLSKNWPANMRVS
jgi:hypothetical protein